MDLKPGIDFTAVSVSFYCHNDDGLFVLHKRSENCRDEIGTWDFGGGRLEFGEDPEVGVLREVLEEYGVEGEIIEQLPALSLIRENKGITTHWLSIPFLIKVDITKIKNGDPEKISEIEFFTLDNLPQPLHKGATHTLKKFEKHFDKYKKSKSGKS
ncbi:MAG: NUDIX hydrolase [Candidatus Daviesbacteria bacterium]|nr:NUDIX hydrolase [Candidatus Daviesbacteria bacterium]